MANKKAEMKTYKATISLEFDAPSRDLARERAKEAFAGKDVKIRLQEQVLGWLTLPESAPSA